MGMHWPGTIQPKLCAVQRFAHERFRKVEGTKAPAYLQGVVDLAQHANEIGALLLLLGALGLQELNQAGHQVGAPA